MKIRFKRILFTLVIAFLACFSLFLVVTIISTTGTILNNNKLDFSNEKELIEEINLAIWRKERELEYADKYCELQSLLPSNTSDTPTISLEVEYYENRAEIGTIYNPFPEKTSVYELGVVTKSDDSSIDISDLQVRLYRIELIDEPQIFIEYVSNRDIPLFYLSNYNRDSEFLLYPLITKYKDIVNTKTYIKVI